jgi:hypothetical protein
VTTPRPMTGSDGKLDWLSCARVEPCKINPEVELCAADGITSDERRAGDGREERAERNGNRYLDRCRCGAEASGARCPSTVETAVLRVQ